MFNYYSLGLIGLLLLTCSSFAQTVLLKGVIKDALSQETLVQATIRIGDEGTITDFNGNYELELVAGSYEVTASYIGYEPTTKTVSLTDGIVYLDFDLKESNVMMNEINVVADVAISRETPVAFSTVPLAKIQEEISVQDLPMVLNSTPGVYATQSGGGDGDARITIRGFNQRNIAILIDGVPVNDMENGWVYWSNWSGLANVARSLQVQRGLGASKLALPSVGGTINLITKGIESKKGIAVKQQVGSDGFLQTNLSATSGRLKNGWGITFTGSYRKRDGWVDNTQSEAWFYFLKVEKMLKNHTLGFSIVGAPQEHGQRSFKQKIAKYDIDYAAELGVDTAAYTENASLPYDLGTRYNPHWGELQRFEVIDGDTIFQQKETVTERLNYYHKPQMTLKDFWTVNDRLNISNILYLSLGNGGGTQRGGSGFGETSDGLIDYQVVYNSNSNPLFWDGESPRLATNFLRTSVNNHVWYGLLSTFDYVLHPNWDLSGGIDVRNYRGIHRRELLDLLGGDYAGKPSDPILEGDILDRDYDGLVKWGGVFTQAEYKKDKISAFLNLTSALTNYQRADRFESMDTTANPRIPLKTVTKNIFGFTVKTGANYNINDNHNVFFNTGYLDKAPPFNNVFGFNNLEYQHQVNEKITALEVGYGYKSKTFSANVNVYNTVWLNKPQTGSVRIDDENVSVNVGGLKAVHRGIEVDYAYQIIPNKLKLEGLASIGDWTWQTDSTAVVEGTVGDEPINIPFSANGVHVGDAAQIQLGQSIRFEPIKNFYTTAKYTYFAKNFADFSPDNLQGENADRDSWQLPNYGLLDFHAGYKFPIGKLRAKLGFSLLNALNTKYISDASTRDGFEIEEIEVFFGTGRRWSSSFQIQF